MSVFKRCGSARQACARADHRCEHSWWSAHTVRGQRHPAVSVDAYAIPRGARGHVWSKREAEEWDAKIRVDWQQGRDPRQDPQAPTPGIRTVSDALADYERLMLPKLKVQGPPTSEVKHIRAFFGSEPLTVLGATQRPQEFLSALREGWRPPKHGQVQAPLEDGRGPAAVNRIMARLRNVVNWCRAQQPTPWLTSTPFHRFGIVISATTEVQRTRRLRPEADGMPGEEATLLAACDLVDDLDHRFAGRALKRRIVGTLTIGARGSELDRVRVQHVNFRQHRITLQAGKSRQPRTLAWDEDSLFGQLLQPRRFLKPPHDFVFGDEDGEIVCHRSAWETVVLLAHGQIRADGAGRTAEASAAAFATIDLHFHDLRRECASRWWAQGQDLRRIQLWLGHSKITTTERYLALPDTWGLAADMAAQLGYTTKRRSNDVLTSVPREAGGTQG